MKILVIDTTTKKPLTNTKIQIQVRGKDSGYLSLTTDATGALQLEDKFKGQQIAHYLQGGVTTNSQWLTATDGAKLMVNTTTTTAKGTTTGSKQTI